MSAAETIQRVTTRTGQAAGVVLWETKRAKDWSPQWIGKLKEDMRRDGADLGVLVTMAGAIPTEWDSGQLFGLHQDVWVTTWSTAIGLAKYCAKDWWMFTSSGSSRPERARRWKLCTTT